MQSLVQSSNQNFSIDIWVPNITIRKKEPSLLSKLFSYQIRIDQISKLKDDCFTNFFSGIEKKVYII